MPGFVVKAQAVGVGDIDAVHQRERCFLHAGFDVAAFAVERIELPGQLRGPDRILRQQAFDAHRHVCQPTGRVQPWSDHKAQFIGGYARRIASGHPEQRLDAGAGASGANAPQSLVHEDAIVVVKAHHIGDGPKGDKIQKFGQIRFLALAEPAATPQFGAQADQDIKHHTDPGQVLARKAAAMLVGIDDARRIRGVRARKVMIGDEYVDAESRGLFDPFDAGDAVVDRNQEVGFAAGRQPDDFRGESVAVFETVRHQVFDFCAEPLQAQHADRAGGGAVRIVVGHDQETSVGGDRIGQQRCHGRAIEQRVERQQSRERRIQLRDFAHAAGRIDSCQDGMHAAGAQRLTRRGGHRALKDAGGIAHDPGCGARSAAAGRHNRHRWRRLTYQR